MIAIEKLRFWCDMSMECVRRDHTMLHSPGDQKGPFLSARAMGMALAALNDANAHASGRSALLPIPDSVGLKGKNADIAGAAACAQVLRLRYPNQSHLLEPAWRYWLEYSGLGSSVTPAEEAAKKAAEKAGRAFGTLVHQIGKDDGIYAVDDYTPTNAAYTHIAPETDPMQAYKGGKWGSAKPLLASRVEDFPPPPGRVSPIQVQPTSHYQQDFAKVYVKGNIDRTPIDFNTRTLAEEVIGIAWGYDGSMHIGTPPRLYMQVVLTILDLIEAREPKKLSVEDELTIIAGIGIAMADAGIDAWHYKYQPTHMMWRPAVGIRKAQIGNGTADPDWRPLGRPDTNGSGLGLTPDFPAYPSGHATFGAAAFQLLRLFLVEKGVANFHENGVDNISFVFVSDEYNGRNRDPRTMQPRNYLSLGYPSLWNAITDNSLSRVFLGVHWQFDGMTKRNAENTDGEFGIPNSPSELGKTGGVWLGAKIANQIAKSLKIQQKTIDDSKIS